MANTTLEDNDLEGAFLTSDKRPHHANLLDVEFQIQLSYEMCDCIFCATYPFCDPSLLQHSGDLSHVDVSAMHEVNGGFDKNDIYVPQYD